METWEPGERWRFGALQATALGALLGGVEALALAVAPLPWAPVELLVAGGVAVVADAVLGGVLGLVAGAVHTLRRGAPGYRNVALQLGLVGGALAVGASADTLRRLVAEGRPGAAVATAAIAVGAGFVVHVNARYWLARREIGRAGPVRWTVAAGGGAAALLGAAVGLGAFVDRVPAFALPGDPSALVVTVEGLDEATLAGAPAMRALAARGTAFPVAVAPSPSAVASVAAALTSLHPLRHGALADDHALLGVPTLAARLADEGFATAAFVASARMSGVGLDRGFAVFDDEASPWRVGRVRAVRALAGPVAVRRPAGEVAAVASAWIAGHAATPMLVWVHLDGRDGVGAVDTALARLVAAVEAAGLGERTLIVVAGAVGPEGPGGAGLPERRLRVPLVLVAPGLPRVPEVPHAVRLTDVAATVLAWAALERPGVLEGVDLLGFLEGRRAQSLWTVVVGRVDGRWRLGLRQDSVKAVLDVDVDELALFDLASDPSEARDVAADQPEAARAARDQLAAEVGRLRRAEAASPPLGPARAAVLRALEAP